MAFQQFFGARKTRKAGSAGVPSAPGAADGGTFETPAYDPATARALAALPPWFLYQYATKLPGPGAMAMGLVTEWLAPQGWIGPAIAFAQQYAAFAPQNVQMVGVAAKTGLGGLVHGQNVLQPLYNPGEGEG
jgi:hypothetical protein